MFCVLCTGSIYIDECPGDRNRIPTWLIVFGCVSLAQTFVNICKRCVQQISKGSRDRGSTASDTDEESGNAISRCGGCIESLLSGFLFVWIIVGSVWVFGVYTQYKNDVCSECCHPVPYLFSFITLVVFYTIGALFCCCLCCCFCCLLSVGAAASDDED